MEAKKHSQKFLKQRKFLLILPFLVLPFITIFFIALGGGKGKEIQKEEHIAGLNMKLPEAQFKKGKEKDKLAIYEETGKDSARIKTAIKNDPYRKYETDSNTLIENKTVELQNILQQTAAKYNQKSFTDKRLNNSVSGTNADSNEENVIQKLAQLKKTLNQKSNLSHIPSSKNNPGTENINSMIQAINTKNNEPDPEVSQLNGMLDKIMLIQHPESLQDSMRRLSEKNKAQSFVVSAAPSEEIIPGMDTAFYGLNDEKNESAKQNAIEAVIHETQTLVSGATVKLRLLNDIYINGIKIPKDQFVYGTASQNGERLKIVINSIRYQKNLLAVSLNVYDMDGMAGIYIPGSINRDVSKESADDAISSIGLTTVDPSVGAQATSAGIQAAKTLLSKKIKLIRVTVKAGYKVLLKDSNQK